MQIDHVGLVVPNIEAGIKHWETVFGYRQATEVVLNTRQKVKVVFMEKADSMQVKLIEPTDPSSPAAAMKLGGMHHLCFYTDDLDAELERLKGLRCRTIAPPQPGEAFDDERIAFVFAKQGLNIEIIETKKRRNRLPEPDSGD